METILNALQNTNSNIEKLTYLLTVQGRQQQWLLAMLQQQNTKVADGTNTEAALSTAIEMVSLAQQNLSGVVNILCNSYHSLEIEVNKLDNSYHFTEKELNKLNNSYHKTIIGVNNDVASTSLKMAGVINSVSSSSQSMIGVNNNVASIFKPMIGVNNENTLSKMPIIDVNKIDIHKLKAGIRVVMLKCNNDSINNVAIILKQLYQNPKQSHKDLMKLTGLSVDGMAKHIRMLKKRELVHKTGFQHYELSEKSLDILRGAMG